MREVMVFIRHGWTTEGRGAKACRVAYVLAAVVAAVVPARRDAEPKYSTANHPYNHV